MEVAGPEFAHMSDGSESGESIGGSECGREVDAVRCASQVDRARVHAREHMWTANRAGFVDGRGRAN